MTLSCPVSAGGLWFDAVPGKMGDMRNKCAVWVCVGLLAAAGQPVLFASGAVREVANQGFRLELRLQDGVEQATLDALPLRLRVADGPYFYRASRGQGGRLQTWKGLSDATLSQEGDRLIVHGRLAGLDLEDSFFLPSNRPWMEERIVLHNGSNSRIALADFEAGFLRQVTDSGGKVFAEMRPDRWVAAPLRIRAADPGGFVNDFSIQELVSTPGYEPIMDCRQHCTRVPSRHRRSEGWAWIHGDSVLGIFVFNQQNLLFSVVSTEHLRHGKALRFGGACMISGEPDALKRIAPGQSVDLGVVRYEAMKGGYRQAEYALRNWLDAEGCRFPPDFNPPVHWEQLYNMPGAWDDRPHHYTKAILEKEAAKALAYHCEALYLDPGWDTAFGSLLWGEKWLGPRRAFIEEMQSKYGLKVSLHCPLATWISEPYTMGPSSVDTWPKAARLKPPATVTENRWRVPALRVQRRNLALLPSAKATASSVYEGGAMPIHQIAHLNDGWYGNSASWIADKMPAWAQIDLGKVYQISEVCLGNDHEGQFTDRATTKLRILVATNYQAGSTGQAWRTVAQYDGPGLLRNKTFVFAPVSARRVRIELLQSRDGLPRLDEIEIYEAEPASTRQQDEFAKIARRGPKPPWTNLQPLLCLGSVQYRREVAKRLLANCADGVVFLMYDGDWWNGGCSDTEHGHPVPYLMEDHIRACLDLVQRVHKQFPKVLIELHDPIAGGSPVRFTPVYYKYGLPGSYDDNWGFELMWNSMADLKEGRARSLYYYDLGCDVPIYLHVNLTGDNEHCVLLWWYASTCRHLGIGGTSPNPAVVPAQQQAMAWYAPREAFFKRGNFFGMSPEIHLHVLPKEKAFVVNLFNLSDSPRVIHGTIQLKTMGLDPQGQYHPSGAWGPAAHRFGSVANGRFSVNLELPAWAAEAAEFRATASSEP